MHIRRTLFPILVLITLLSSCATQQQMTYFQDLSESDSDSINAHLTQNFDPVIRCADAMLIQVTALDAEAATPYNMTAYTASSGNSLSVTPQLVSYVVDERGNITMPVIGTLHVEGLTKSELRDTLQSILSKQIKDPIVTINLQNRRVTVMGEVNRPGQVYIPNGRLTIMEALAASGDLTIYGQRDNILITREVNGQIQIARLNLNHSDVFSSPYYYLQENDLIYVSPNRVRAITSQNVGLWLSMVSTVASAATVIVTVINATK